MSAGFGVFAPLFKNNADYLALLHLEAPETKRVVERVVEQCRLSATSHEEVGKLFDQPNWRPHLVGAIAVAALPHDRESCDKLWWAFDRGSGVTPQLAVAAVLRDPGGVDLARARILSRCPVDESSVQVKTALERNVSAGPAAVSRRSAKAAASLVCLAGRLPVRPDWLDAEASKADLIELLDTDTDHSAEIADHWLVRLTELLNPR